MPTLATNLDALTPAVSPYHLTPVQRRVLDECLTLLQGDTLTDADQRQNVSRIAARTIGLHLPEGAEIAECTGCGWIHNGDDVTDTADGLRCEDCAPTPDDDREPMTRAHYQNWLDGTL